jgi:hypothetical protein
MMVSMLPLICWLPLNVTTGVGIKVLLKERKTTEKKIYFSEEKNIFNKKITEKTEVNTKIFTKNYRRGCTVS